MAAPSPSKAPNNHHGKRCNKCSYFAVFMLLATFGHLTLFYSLHVCKNCIVESKLWLLPPPQQQRIQKEDYWLTNQLRKERSHPKAAIISSQNTTVDPNHFIAEKSTENFDATDTAIFHAPRPPNNKSKWIYNRTSWRPRPDHYFTVPFPVFVASLPKSGTTSIYAYFLCGGVRSVHTFCPYRPKVKSQMRVGTLIEENIKNGYPPFHGCGTGVRERHGPVHVFSDTGYVYPEGPCYYPSVSALEAMYEHYPNMTIVLGTRNSTNWYQSFSKWAGGDLVLRWAKYCSFMPDTVDPDQFIEFYEWHNRHIRKFVRQHPSITFLEFEISSPTVGEYLESATNISASCWGHSRPVDSTIAWTLRAKKKKGDINSKQKHAPQRQISRLIFIKGGNTTETNQHKVHL